MTDEARIARLTELARRVWPYLSEVEVVAGPKGILVAGNDPHVAPDAPRTGQLYINHWDSPVPLLDALEAALLVLAGDDSRLELARLREDVASTLREELARRGEPPAWVKQLASEWGSDAQDRAVKAQDPFAAGVGVGIQYCAAELRERAKARE